MVKSIRPRLHSFIGYQPLAPQEALSQSSGVPVEKIIKLDGNENPYGCSPRVQEALAHYSGYHLYPDPTQYVARQALSDYVGVGTEHLVLGSGSDELIDLICRICVDPGDKVIVCEPTFPMYRFFVDLCGGLTVNVPRNPQYDVDVKAVKAAIDGDTKMIFLASPNNPSGNSIPKEDVLSLLEAGILVVVDEAYYEFSGATVAPLVPSYENLIVLRSFSKWAGLAGLRVGYGIFPQSFAEMLFKIKPPYNVNAAAQLAVVESLADIDYLKATVDAILAERERLSTLLKASKILKPLSSEANFILCPVIKGEAPSILQKLRREGVFVRYYNSPGLENCLRISVGKPEHTDALIEALNRLGEKDG
ncbi:MAG: histidinol-phosphate transaminase [Chloroflexi bacterium]|nr:histidinol-phosphate transaminase [Chloroflexota bacterium]